MGKIMKKLLSTLLVSTAVFAGAQAVSADQNIVANTDADIAVAGTLGADNTKPDAKIPEGDKDWINVTLPTEAIFYNKTTDPIIKSPTYNLVNNSGRPVKISLDKFTPSANNSAALPSNFDLTLDVTGDKVVTQSTSLVKGGALAAAPGDLLILANSVDQQAATDSPQPDPTAVTKNKGTFTFAGQATATTDLNLAYTLSLKFEAVKFQ